MRKYYPNILLFILLAMPVLLMANAAKPLHIQKIIHHDSKHEISLCAEVDRYFSATDGDTAKPSITLLPDDHFGVTLSYDEICLTGLKPQTDYTFTIHRDIPLGEVTLDRSYTFSRKTGDFAPSLQFKDGGYILPAKGEITLPIETTNIDKIAVSLYRINRDNLIGSINDYGLFQTLSSYRLQEIGSQDGYLLWEKILPIRSQKNHPKTTAIPVGKFLTKREPGVYILAASPLGKKGEEDEYAVVTQWFMISDIGLFTLKGADGLTVHAKHLSDAAPYTNVKLELVAKNNELLGQTFAKEGRASFPVALLNGKRGLRPKAIYAYGKRGDFTVLDLSRPAHDLSDRGVNGRKPPVHYDAYLYSNRGIFRPGEHIPFHLLVRTPLGDAVDALKVSAKLFDSREVKVGAQLLTTDTSGYAESSFEIAPTASTGKWRLALFAGGEEPIGSLQFLVEDFIPPKISIALLDPPEKILPHQEIKIKAVAKYLTEEVLPHADVEVSTILHSTQTPFPAFRAYHFGKADETFANEMLETLHFQGGSEGNITIPLTINRRTRTSLPTAAHITLSVREAGGRPVQKTVDIFYEDKSAYIGIKPAFKNHAVNLDTKALFELIYLKHAKPASALLHYRLIKEEVLWHWRSGNNGAWEYYKTYSDNHEIQNGTLSVGTDPLVLTLPMLDWGSYRLEVSDPKGIISSYRFSSGYEESVSRASPDRLPLATDKKQYHRGEKVKVQITPKFSGPLMVSVAQQRILETQETQAKEGVPLTLEFEVKDSWGSGVYLLGSAFRAQSSTLGASRAIGVSHISIIAPEKQLKLSLTYPDRIYASDQLTVMVHAKENLHEPIHLTLAAVDEGVLNLTGYPSPDPIHFFYGQRRLGMEIRDVYGDLIKAIGAHAAFEVGAGDALVAALHDSVVSNKRSVVALQSKMLTLDAEGKATVQLKVPDFQGTLRLMAVAWSKHAVGSATGKVLVKDPLSTELYMPSFMGLGDRSILTLRSSFDETLAPGTYQFTLHTQGGISLSPEAFSTTIGKRGNTVQQKRLSLTANSQETGSITLEVLHEGISIAKRNWQIGIRAAYPPSYVRKIGLLHRDQTLDAAAFSPAAPWRNIHALSLKLSGMPLLPAASISKELIDYRGRCAEQTTSRAMPWLESKTEAKQTLVKRAIERLSSMQRISGGFGLWSSSQEETWITAYALDFLTRAQAKGYAVPKKNIQQGLRWLQQHLDRWNKTRRVQEADAYALYVLTRAKKILLSEIHYHTETPHSAIRSAQAWGHLAATLASLGEKKRSREIFKKAIASLGNYPADAYAHYGGLLRDKAALVMLLKAAGMHNKAEALYGSLALDLTQRKYLSTQEMSMLLRADHAINLPKSKITLAVNGIVHKQEAAMTLNAPTLSSLPQLKNLGSQPLWYDLSFIATPDPLHYSAQKNKGFRIEKKLYTLQGEEISLDQLKQNSRIAIVLRGEIQDRAIHYPLITDWLPAGFEIENPTLSGIDTSSALTWLGDKTPVLHSAYRNDRFVTALRRDGNNSFVAAYIARAVSLGSFTLPPAKIEDMYQPHYRAFSPFAPEKVIIKTAQEMQLPTQQAAVTLSREQSKPLSSERYVKAAHTPIGDLHHYSLMEIHYLRNGIFAQAGLNFAQSNPALHKRFSAFEWYHPRDSRSANVYARLTPLQKKNVQRLLREEKRRCGGLVLADFYRVKIKALTTHDLKRYTKKELRILRNSLIARYGLAFKDPALTRIFSEIPWYHPTKITASEIIDRKMNDLERANMQLILKMERQH